MRKELTIPTQMAHIKIDTRGYPIPFFVPTINGVPNFKLASQQKQEIAINQHLCHICGKKLNKAVHYFISGPMGLQNQVCSDAAMHKECAEFSLMACPHMFFERAERKIEEDLSKPSPHIYQKPTELYLIKSNKYEAKFYKEFGYKLIHFRAIGYEKYIYIDNKLQKA